MPKVSYVYRKITVPFLRCRPRAALALAVVQGIEQYKIRQFDTFGIAIIYNSINYKR